MTSQSHSLPVTCFLLLIVCVCVCVLCLSRSLNTCIMWLVGWKRKTIEWSATSTRALSKTFFFSLALYSSSFQIWGLYWNDTFVFSLSLSVSISFCLRQIVQCIWSEYCNWLHSKQIQLNLNSYRTLWAAAPEHSMVMLRVLCSRKPLVYCVEKQLLGEHMTSILQKGEPEKIINIIYCIITKIVVK